MALSPRYGSNSRDTSKWVKDLLNDYNKMPRGVFNLNHRKIFDAPIFGIIPFDCFEMLPNSEMYLKYDVQMLSKNPTVKRLLSGMHVELATYRIDYNDTWEAWNNFITKGRSGKVETSIPYVDYSLGTITHTTCLPYSPAFLMNMAPAVFLAKNGEAGSGHEADAYSFEYNTGVKAVENLDTSGLTGITTLAGLNSSTAMRQSALPFVLYNKICKKYQNSNLLQTNPHWYPENENHDNILPYEATGPVTNSTYDNPIKSFVPDQSVVYPSAEIDSFTDECESYPWLNVLQLANRKGNYLNSGSPFPDLVRGDIPTLEAIGAELNSDAIDWTDAIDGTPLGLSSRIVVGLHEIISPSVNNNLMAGQLGTSAQSGNPIISDDELVHTNKLKAALNKVKLSDKTVKGINFSMRQWRYLATMTVMKERLALTDGSYNSLIEAMFGHNPKWHNHEPQFCGGSIQPIVFSEVVNTSDNGVSPLGETAGRAITSSQNSLIHVKSDDFGCYISVLIVIPDEYECQGVKKMWNRLENAQQYFPILNNLSPDATNNKEAFVSGNNTTDEDVFNYQERFAYYKSESNEVSGLMGLPISKIGDVGAYVQNRILSSTPEFNQEYIRGVLTDNEKAIFASTNQAEFATVVSIQKRYIAPIPEDSRPSDMGISY